MELLNVVTIQGALDLMETVRMKSLDVEIVSTMESLGRVLAEDVVLGVDIPVFARSTVDGFAVIARDTFGASEGAGTFLEVTGEVRMGPGARHVLETGKAVRIPTGGMLPENADAVVMLEYTEELGDGLILVNRPVAPGENAIQQGEDLRKGETLFKKGHRIRAVDVGAISGIGNTRVKVVSRPKVAVISTGDEIIEAGAPLALGCIYDINGPALMGYLKSDGAEPVWMGIVPDDKQKLLEVVSEAIDQSDAVVLSGGSSVGARDATLEVLRALQPRGVLFHGLSLKPGKPAMMAMVDGTAVFGLPGHPVSAMVVYELVVRSYLKKLMGEEQAPPTYVSARLSRNVPSAAGREDYIRCTLRRTDGVLWADPVLGKSGLISTMTRAHAFIRIPPEKGGYEAGELVEIRFFGGR